MCLYIHIHLISMYGNIFFVFIILQADMNILESNISYLQSKNFSFDGIGHIITVAPRFLLMSVSALDGKLGFYQNFFKLSGIYEFMICWLLIFHHYY